MPQLSPAIGVGLGLAFAVGYLLALATSVKSNAPSTKMYEDEVARLRKQVTGLEESLQTHLVKLAKVETQQEQQHQQQMQQPPAQAPVVCKCEPCPAATAVVAAGVAAGAPQRVPQTDGFVRQRLICTESIACSSNLTTYRPDKVAELFLRNLRLSIIGTLNESPGYQPSVGSNLRRIKFDPNHLRLHGLDWPIYAVSMAGQKRMEKLHEILHGAYRKRGLTGDFLEAGTWRGGSSIYAKGFMEAYGIDKTIWVCDSFRGLPKNQDGRDLSSWAKMDYLSVPMEQVKDNFERYGLYDAKVRFVRGYFQNSLPKLRSSGLVQKIAVLRLDGDMYKSTIDILCNLYDFVEVGGYYYVDDWRIGTARRAVQDFIGAHDAKDAGPFVIPGPDGSAYFEKAADVTLNKTWCDIKKGPILPPSASAKRKRRAAPPGPPVKPAVSADAGEEPASAL
eukprot:TRINITY_DN10329_c0_g1_i1.p1 TRINITY_DN10329_c0_g1~~TRINITY_DN10329_c0_g1_i1.p1  ORF type:complete len:449 (+),score=122.10 TRINITY_DN10329_c0_g1_i1:72-1418(+)